MSVGGDGLCRLLIWIRLCSDDQSLKYFLLKYVKQVSRCSHQVKQWFMPSFAWLRAELCKHVCRHVCANTFQSFKASLGLSERYIVHVRICVCPVCVLRQISDSSQPKVISFSPSSKKQWPLGGLGREIMKPFQQLSVCETSSWRITLWELYPPICSELLTPHLFHPSSATHHH